MNAITAFLAGFMKAVQPILESLKLDWRYLVAQIVLFVLLTLVLNQVFWKPMLAHLANRDQDLKDAYDKVDKTRHDMENLRSDYQTRIVKIEADARSHIQQAIKEAQTQREQILAAARAQADAAIREGIETMEREKSEALISLRERMVGIALLAVDKAVGKAVDPISLRSSIEHRIAARN